jgi:hypothetical protein
MWAAEEVQADESIWLFILRFIPLAKAMRSAHNGPAK